MQWFRNLRVGIKLIGAFCAMAALAGLVGFIGVQNMSKINDMGDAIYNTELLGLSYIKEANTDLVYIGRARGNVLLATTLEGAGRNSKDAAPGPSVILQAQGLIRCLAL